MVRPESPAVWFPSVRAGSGADVYVMRLVQALNRRGLRAEAAWLPKHAEYAPWTLPKHTVPPWANVVHVNSWLPARFIACGLPMVATVHHLVHDPMYAPYRSMAQAAYHRLLIRPRELRAIARADAVVAVSSYVADTVQSFSGRRPDRVIPNWVDVERYVPARVAPRRDKPFKLLISGNQTRRKGLDLLPGLIRALGSGFQIRCTGGLRGDQARALQGVVLLGRLEESALISEYQACDAVLSLSRYEGFGLTAVEAMACGKPFLGFRTSALAETVGADAGMLVPLEDIDALATCARKLRDQPDLADRMGKAGRALAVSRYAEDNVDAYVELYGSLAKLS